MSTLCIGMKQQVNEYKYFSVTLQLLYYDTKNNYIATLSCIEIETKMEFLRNSRNLTVYSRDLPKCL